MKIIIAILSLGHALAAEESGKKHVISLELKYGYLQAKSELQLAEHNLLLAQIKAASQVNLLRQACDDWKLIEDPETHEPKCEEVKRATDTPPVP